MIKKLVAWWRRSKLLAWITEFVDEPSTAKSRDRALKHTVWLLLAFVAALAVGSVILLKSDLGILDPKGLIAGHQRDLLMLAAFLALIIVIPVFILTFTTAWKYREDNKKADYKPDFDNSNKIEAIWWGVPLLLILVLSAITWKSSHDLDPFKPIASDKKPLTVQVVAMRWKWLFIYPEQNVASLNQLEMPVDTPIHFELTSDAPMNSFWIPRLGGQVYAMSGMKTQLQLMANEVGDYRGVSANISGSGFADMHFTAHASSAADFEAWVNEAKSSTPVLSLGVYGHLAEPSRGDEPLLFSAVDSNLYDRIIMQYMMPGYDIPKPFQEPLAPNDRGLHFHHHGGSEAL